MQGFLNYNQLLNDSLTGLTTLAASNSCHPSRVCHGAKGASSRCVEGIGLSDGVPLHTLGPSWRCAALSRVEVDDFGATGGPHYHEKGIFFSIFELTPLDSSANNLFLLLWRALSLDV